MKQEMMQIYWEVKLVSGEMPLELEHLVDTNKNILFFLDSLRMSVFYLKELNYY
jgi:hypothetical protein